MTQPVNTNYTTSPRYGGDAARVCRPLRKGDFRSLRPTITGGFDEGVGIVSNLKAPYSLVFNANYARPLPGGLVLELGYSGRLYRNGLVQQDFDQPLTEFMDKKSGTTWAQAVGILHNDYLAAGQTYGPIANVPFIEDMFPGLANAFVPGSATQNYYDGWVNINGLSDEDNLNLMDRQRIAGTNQCYSVTGCNTFYPLQQAGLPTWTNNAWANYNALTVTLRHRLANGFSFDFNYTGRTRSTTPRALNPGAAKAAQYCRTLSTSTLSLVRRTSICDTTSRRTLCTNCRSERAGSSLQGANRIVDAFIGGWEASTLFRYHSGLPSTITASRRLSDQLRSQRSREPAARSAE